MNIAKAMLAVALTGLACGQASARGDADFSLVNKTDYAIREIYVSPSKSSNWGEDRLGRHILANGQVRNLHFGDSAHCHQGVQVVFDDDGSEVTWEDVNLCEIEELTLHYNRKTHEVSTDVEQVFFEMGGGFCPSTLLVFAKIPAKRWLACRSGG